MHINHRRTNKFRARHHNRWSHPVGVPSKKWYRRLSSKERRSEEREHIAHERYDTLPVRYPRDIHWRFIW